MTKLTKFRVFADCLWTANVVKKNIGRKDNLPFKDDNNHTKADQRRTGEVFW